MPATSAGVFYVETSANFPISNGDILTVKRGDAEIGTISINGISTTSAARESRISNNLFTTVS